LLVGARGRTRNRLRGVLHSRAAGSSVRPRPFLDGCRPRSTRRLPELARGRVFHRSVLWSPARSRVLLGSSAARAPQLAFDSLSSLSLLGRRLCRLGAGGVLHSPCAPVAAAGGEGQGVLCRSTVKESSAAPSRSFGTATPSTWASACRRSSPTTFRPEWRSSCNRRTGSSESDRTRRRKSSIRT